MYQGVHCELHRGAGAERPDVENLRGQRVEDRPGALERRRVAADHDRELALLDGGHASRHRRVEERGAGRRHGLADATDGVRRDRAHLEDDVVRAGGLRGAVLAEIGREHGLVVGQTAEHHV